jgi:hypothetical protein
MNRLFRCLFFLCLLAPSLSAFAGSKWTDPTPEELRMTADPAYPGANALFLFLDESVDDNKHEATFYARIKILTENGKQYADIVLPFTRHESKIRGIEGRTIHADGSIVPFTDKPWEKAVLRAGGYREMEKGFSMPDVQIGSILEYRYMTTYDDFWMPPQWYLQKKIPVREAHYRFVPALGQIALATRFLPPHAQESMKGQKVWELRVTDLPPVVEEEDAPPFHSLGYRVLFYYGQEGFSTPNDFWEAACREFSKEVDAWVAPEKLTAAVSQIVAPGDSDEQKLRKIYAAVMKLENTDFTRERTEEEEPRGKSKIASAADVWQRRSGNRQQIALLFIGLARAAGLQAWAMRVVNRDQNVFTRSLLDFDQLDDIIAVVSLGGKEMYFDPGDRYCEFGKLHWKHSWTTGVRETALGEAKIADTPAPSDADTVTRRSADLRIDANGQVQGSIRFEITGSAALALRESALLTDAQETGHDLAEALRTVLPPGLSVTSSGLTGLDDYTVPVVATFQVDGPLGTRTGKRLFLPASFFEAQVRPRFSAQTRQNPVYLPYAYSVEDAVTITLPSGAAFESLPQDADIPWLSKASYKSSWRTDRASCEYHRTERVEQLLYSASGYPDLRNFFQQISSHDQAQLVLTFPPSPSTADAQKTQ